MNTILHLTIGHCAFDDRIFFKEARSLTKIGDVILFSSSSDGFIRNMSGDKFLEGDYENVKQVAFESPESIFRGLFPITFKRKLLKVLGVYYLIAKKNITKRIKELDVKPDVIHIHEPQLMSTAVKLKKIYNCKIIFDCHEMHLISPFDRYRNKLLAIISFNSLKKNISKYLINFDFTVSVNNYIRSVLLAFNPYGNHYIISNSSIFKGAAGDINDKQITLVHEGMLNFGRGLKLMIDIFNDPWFKQNVELKIVGSLKGEEKKYLDKQIKKNEDLSQCIKSTGWVDYLDVPNQLNNCHIGIIFMEPKLNNLMAGPPNKLYNYLACGLPVISVDLPATTDSINQWGVGEIVNRDILSIKEAIQKILNNYSYYKDNIRQSEQYYNWNYEEQSLSSLYLSILEKNSL